MKTSKQDSKFLLGDLKSWAFAEGVILLMKIK